MKYHGAVGYATTAETVPGVWKPVITERIYYGDVLSEGRRWDNGDNQLNDNLRITNKFSILADPYAYQHFQDIKYITFGGVKWKVKTISVEGRRLILNVGEEYNGCDEKNKARS